MLEDRTLLSGPEIVRDINQSAIELDWQESYRPIQLRVLGSKLIYWAYATDGASEALLVVSDGTDNGTRTLRKFQTIGESVVAGDWLYFIGDDGFSGPELWRTDGTLTGTELVKDISPGPSGNIDSLTAVGNKVFFGASAPRTGFELWKSDGTAAGTVLVKDIQPGPGSSGVANLTSDGIRVYFSADNGASGRELWSSDGTAAGTLLVKDIAPGPASGLTPYPMFAVAGGLIYFLANDGVHGQEPWRTDGTAAGTTLVQDIAPGAASSMRTYSMFWPVGDSVYFAANDGVHGVEPWKTNGTSPGAAMVADVMPGGAGSEPQEFTRFGSQVFFSANGAGVGNEVWKTDGTATGTVLFGDFRPGTGNSYPGSFFEHKGELFLQEFKGRDNYLLKTDGIDSPTPVAVGYGWQFTEFNDQLYYLGGDGVATTDLWKTDGTTAGTLRVGSVFPGRAGSRPRYLTAANGLLYFAANDGPSGQELWRSDGTEAGTFRVGDFHPGTGWAIPRTIEFNGSLYFTLEGGPNRGDLFKTDGTVAGTVLVKDFDSAVSSGSAIPSSLTVLNGQLFFVKDDGVNGRALWKTDGTTAGTVLVRDAASGSIASEPFQLLRVGGRLYFGATDPLHGREIWSTDGTDAGTAVLDAIPGPDSRPIAILGALGSDIYFQGAQTATHAELWATDGTVTGTRLVKDIPSETVSSNLFDFVAVGGQAYFRARGEGFGLELWITDGTTAGTRMVKDIEPGPAGIEALRIAEVGSVYVFAAVTSAHGAELWRTDGTDAGTFRLTDLDAGTSAYRFSPLSSTQSFAIVAVSLSNSHGQLWRADGTAAGTYLLQDFGWRGGVSEMVEYRGRYFFIAVDERARAGLWVTDGTVAGTRQISKIDPSADGGTSLTLVGSRLYFAAGTELAGDELMSIDLATDPALLTLETGPVPENSPVGASIGRLEWLSADSSSSLTYTLVAGVGDQDNGRVSIVGDQLLVAGTLDFEAKGNLSIRVRVTNAAGESVENSFQIPLVDVNEAPTAVIHPLGVASIGEKGSPPFVFSGQIIVVDDALGTNVLGLSGPDAEYFSIENNKLMFRGTTLDYETHPVYEVFITVDDPSVGGPIDAMTTFRFVISDFNEFPVSSVTDANSAPNRVPERSAAGTTVGITAFAQDLDGTNNRITYSLWDTRDGRFAIDPVTGVVRVADGQFLDFEVQASWTITVLATSQDGSTSVQDFTIELIDVNEFKVGPVFDLDSAPNRVLEHSPAGTPVGITAFATDLDATNSDVTYSLWNTRGGRFAIDPATGVVTVANGEFLDREVQASWTITVLARSEDGSVSVKDFTIQLEDVNEFRVSQVFDIDPAPNTVIENSASGTPVGITAFAIDLDATWNGVTYSLWNTHGGRFAINDTTGIVTVGNGAILDREAAASWAITILATSLDGSISVKEFKVLVQDADEYNVGQVFDLDPAANSVPENSPAGTTVGITGFGIDLDATRSTVGYSLTDNAGGRFAIDVMTGVVTVANAALLDREAAASWPITVRATSVDGSFSTRRFIIAVTDVDDHDVGPLSDTDVAANLVVENAPPGTPAGITARAVDEDATNNNVSYSLSNTAGGRFQIDAGTGVVSVAPGAVLDFETQTSHQITVVATGNDGSISTKSFTIGVANVFDAPRLTLSNGTVPEEQPSGVVVGTLAFADIEAISPVYTLVSGTGSTDNSLFSISGNQLRTRSRLNFETKPILSIRVQMKGADGVLLTQVFAIQVVNVNEEPTGLTLSPASIAENNAVGAIVGTFSGVDPDAGDSLNYTLVSGSGSTDNARFTIEGNQLKAFETFDYERKRSYSIRVRVTDAAGLSYEKVFTIRITNVRD